ncbi:cytochrome c oxidase assembly protein [Allopontixanthobacter sp.]|uniref:cytochrome c oxidase assembly protein n=1 Tax=Allopontixanthobacter sp. TaxID=2906452 RepID=UPI002ABCAEAB|nr:cytochrome c oxidase assembly protein [Allopontixanthobacter sp.]MDZ4306570.1 cytochrome c oxidase assembly protein [Allopontixanthobacter sp.]
MNTTSGFSQWIPYCGPGPGPAEWFARWNFDPLLITALTLFLLAALRFAPDRKASHTGAALAVLVLFVSPICALGSALFSVRVGHHAALMLVLAPLLVISLGLHKRALPSLTVLTAIQAAVIWLWHAPGLYAAALSSDLLFWTMQITITASAAVWWARLRQAHASAAVTALLATMVQMGALGALLTFAGRAFYAPHFLTTSLWGLSPLEDQQIGGLVMWVVAAAAYLLIAVTLLYRSLEPEARPGTGT